ncbi:MAG: hypothetical protein HY239_05520 [Mycolicibacterium aromaticivorans]|nr:hypothetical protein [Mycolicibacterium aromaticivorans]
MHIDLKFVKSWGAYNAGEIARFAVLRAQPLLERGVAIEHRLEAAVAGSSAEGGGAAGSGEANPARPQGKGK